MSLQQLDIWNNWHRGMSLAFKDGEPVADGYITLRADEQSGCGGGGHGDDGCGCGGHDHSDDDGCGGGCGGCGGHDHSDECGGGCGHDHSDGEHECGCGGHGDDDCGCGAHDHSDGQHECGCGGHGDDDCGCGAHDHSDSGCGCGEHDHGDGDCGCGDSCGCGGHEDNGDTVLHDALVNMLYFAVFRAHCGVRVSGLGEDFKIGADELAAISGDIDYLSHVFGYKTKQINLEQFAREISAQTVYYSTLAGEEDNGEPVFFACTAGDDIDLYPVFLTLEHLKEFFEAYNRSGYVIMQNSFAEFLSMLDSDEQLQSLGAVIEPMLSCAVGFPPGLRVNPF